MPDQRYVPHHTHEEPFDTLEKRARYVQMEPLREVIDSLPSPYRMVLEAVYWEGAPLSEVARRLGVSRSNTIYSVLEAAQAEARRRYEEPIEPSKWAARRFSKLGHVTFDGARPTIWTGAPAPRVRGVLECLRFLDVVEPYLRGKKKEQAALVRTYCEARLLRNRSALPAAEAELRQRILDYGSASAQASR